MGRHVAVVAVILLVGTAVSPAQPLGSQRPSPTPRDLAAARETLPRNDGWASIPTAELPNGTTGGNGASAARTVVVTTRAELVAALNFPDAAPKLIFVTGTIDANVDDAGRALWCEDYRRSDPITGERYAIETFLAAYDPGGAWGRVNPTGPQERARIASTAAQAERVRIRVPANTTIYGLGASATIRGVWLDIRPDVTAGNRPMNVIVRNLHFEDTSDCFPAWSPNDGPTGNWNSNYDAVSVRNSTHVWIDHNRFADRTTADSLQPTYFGRPYQVHDGLLDVTSEADLVTISWNQFLAHDKTMLIGGSDGATADRGKLRVTLHHNFFDGIGQRAPRVRFGQVHAYNNFYRALAGSPYVYSWGVGVESQLVAENNYVELEATFRPADVIERFNGTRLTAIGNCLGVGGTCVAADFIAAWNAAFDPDLVADAGWKPSLYGGRSGAEPAASVRAAVLAGSGPRQ